MKTQDTYFWDNNNGIYKIFVIGEISKKPS